MSTPIRPAGSDNVASRVVSLHQGQARAAAVPCVLETEAERSVGFSKRRGFRVVRAATIKAAGGAGLPLVREP